MSTKFPRSRAWLITGALAAGAALGAAGVANAATSSSSTTSGSSSSSSAAVQRPQGAPPDPAKVAHGPGETLLTGTTAQKVTAAALAKEPGATVVRVETDSEGSPYEAHLLLADGSYVTVKVDSSFKVTTVEQGFGRGPGGPGGMHGAPKGAPNGAPNGAPQPGNAPPQGSAPNA